MLIAGFNLASTDYRRARRARLLGLGVVGLLGLLLAGQLAVWSAGRSERAALTDRLGRMEDEVRRHQDALRTAVARVPGQSIKEYAAQVAAYNRILEAAAFSWMGLLVELERAVPPAVFLREISPDLATGQVHVRGVARSFEDLSQLLHALEERVAFRDVYLLQQAEKKGQGETPEGLEFSVSVLYRDAVALRNRRRLRTCRAARESLGVFITKGINFGLA